MIIVSPTIHTADPWTYIVLGTEFSSTTPSVGVNVPELFFAPLASKTYLVRGIFYIRAGLLTDAPRVGLSWPDGLLHNVATIETVNNTSTTSAKRFIGGTAAQVSPASNFPDDTNDWPAFVEALFTTDSNVSGDFQITLANEVSSSTSIIYPGSFISYRIIS